jgi:hypothetical protein
MASGTEGKRLMPTSEAGNFPKKKRYYKDYKATKLVLKLSVTVSESDSHFKLSKMNKMISCMALQHKDHKAETDFTPWPGPVMPCVSNDLSFQQDTVEESVACRSTTANM